MVAEKMFSTWNMSPQTISSLLGISSSPPYIPPGPDRNLDPAQFGPERDGLRLRLTTQRRTPEMHTHRRARNIKATITKTAIVTHCIYETYRRVDAAASLTSDLPRHREKPAREEPAPLLLTLSG